MTGLMIVGIIFLLLLLLAFVRVGGRVEFGEDGLFARLRIGAFSFQVFPLPSKKPPQKSKKKSKQRKGQQKANARSASAEKPQKTKGGSLLRLKHYLPLVGDAAGMLKKRIRIDTLYLELMVASSDAAETAIAFGYANMVIGLLWTILNENFDICDHQIHTRANFDASEPTVYLKADFSARIGQLFSLGCRLAWKFLVLYQEEKRKKLQKEAI